MRRKKVKHESQSNPMVDDDQARGSSSDGLDLQSIATCGNCDRKFTGQNVLDADGSLTPVGVSSWDAPCPKCGELVSFRSPTDGGETPTVPEDAAAHRTGSLRRSEQLADAELSDVSAPTDKPDEVTVCWGEEKFFPDPADRYSSVVAGAVFVKTSVRPGESHDHAALRAWTIAKRLGVRAREEKVAEFVGKLREIRDQYAR